MQRRLLPLFKSYSEYMWPLPAPDASLNVVDDGFLATKFIWQAMGRGMLHDCQSRDFAQVKATLQELLRIFGAIAKYNPTDTVWIKVLQRRPALLSCTVDQIRNTVSFLEMLDMSPAQVKTRELPGPLIDQSHGAMEQSLIAMPRHTSIKMYLQAAWQAVLQQAQ